MSNQSGSSPLMQKARRFMPHPKCTVIIVSDDSPDAHVLVGSDAAPFSAIVADGELVQGNPNTAREVTIASSRISIL